MNPRDILAPASGREAELRHELQRAYEHLTEITSRLLLANEAADAALSSHHRTELSQRFLEVLCPGVEVTRAALFLAEPEGYSVGATFGLDGDEQEALASSTPDIAACGEAIRSRAPHVVDLALVAGDALAGPASTPEGEGVGGEDGEAADAGEQAEDEEQQEEEEEAAEENEAEGESVPALFGVYLPVYLDDKPAAVLALGDLARGRHYGADDLVFLEHLLRQYALSLHRATLLEQNAERLRELDALVRVSREITSTLDMDAVMRAVVNTVGAVVDNDRAEIALLRDGKLRLRAVTGLTRLDPDQAEIFRLGDPLEYLMLNPVRYQISADDLGEEEEPPGANVFNEYFSNQEMRSFMALPLKDDEGLLGFLCLESRQDSWNVLPAEGDTLDILAAQTTVALRNATLYSEIPLRGVSLPVSKARARLRAMAGRTRTRLLIGVAAVLLALLIPLFPERAGGPAVVRPLRFLGARALSDGVVSRVLVKGGEQVAAGQPLAVVEDLDLAGRLADLEASIEMARRQVAEARQTGDAAAWRAGQVQLVALERNLVFERRRARGTVLSAPFAGQVLELDLAQRVGQHLSAGESFCTVAALDVMAASIEVPEQKIGSVRVGQPVALKAMAYPTRTFRGRVSEVGWRGETDARGNTRFEVRAEIDNARQALRPGMTGIGKATIGRRSLAGMALDPFLRAVRLGWW